MGFQNNIRDLQIQRYISFITQTVRLVLDLKRNIDNGRIYRLGSLKSESGFHRFPGIQNKKVIGNYSLIIVPNIGSCTLIASTPLKLPPVTHVQDAACIEGGTVRSVWAHSIHFWCSTRDIKDPGLFSLNSVPDAGLWPCSFHVEYAFF